MDEKGVDDERMYSTITTNNVSKSIYLSGRLFNLGYTSDEKQKTTKGIDLKIGYTAQME